MPETTPDAQKGQNSQGNRYAVGNPTVNGSIIPHQLDHMAAEVQRLQNRIGDLEAVLRQVEWIDVYCPETDAIEKVCSLCGQEPHATDCRLQAVLLG